MVPQHPPTKVRPYESTKFSKYSASSSGPSGYVAPLGPSCGSPAFGITEIPIVLFFAKTRRCSLISAGPVAQFRPIRSIFSGSNAFKAAPISEPSNIVPVASTVTCAIKTISRGHFSIASRAPLIAAFACSKS